MLALSYQQAGQVQKALAFALTAHEAAPEKVDAALLSAELLLGLGAFKEAAKLLAPFCRSTTRGCCLPMGWR